MRIPVYKAEVDLGLADMVRASGSISYASEIIDNSIGVLEFTKTRAKQLLQAIGTNEGQIDLHYLKTILVTTGWNKNDDVFDRKETWGARYTPEDKPFNIEHDPRQIRGHITGNYVVNEDGGIVPDNTTVDDLPVKYHVVTAAVLYKFLKSKDAELEKEMEQIIAEVKKGDWFVSMECLFSNFDYAVTASNGSTKVIPRDEESAFLTKHLRAYGGDGVYEDYKIGRLLRNITFSGKGLVRRPANPESIIFREVAAFQAAASKEFTELKQSVGYKPVSENNSSKERLIMAEPNAEVTVLQSQLKSTESTLATVTKKNDELEKRLNELNEKQVQAKFAEVEAQVKSKDERITNLDTQLKAEQKARTEAEEKLTKATEKLTTLETELNKVNTEKATATRVNAWVERTGVATDLAQKAVARLAKLDDEEFKDFLETQPAKASTATPPAESEADKKKAAEAAASGSKNADKSKLENVETPKEPPLANAGVDSGVEATRAALGNFFRDNYLSSGKKTKANTNAQE